MVQFVFLDKIKNKGTVFVINTRVNLPTFQMLYVYKIYRQLQEFFFKLSCVLLYSCVFPLFIYNNDPLALWCIHWVIDFLMYFLMSVWNVKEKIAALGQIGIVQGQPLWKKVQEEELW